MAWCNQRSAREIDGIRCSVDNEELEDALALVAEAATELTEGSGGC